jgi:hypothetical protein
MRRPTSLAITVLLAGVLIGMTGLPAANATKKKSGHIDPCLQWDVRDGATANRSQGERLYRSVCRWVQENVWPQGEPVRPCVTVRVGKLCPSKEELGCVNLANGEIMLREWNEGAPGYITQGVLYLAVMQKLDDGAAKDVAFQLITKDARFFLDARNLK